MELNATYRARPTQKAVANWVARTPESFRFAVKAQRGAAWRAMTTSPAESVSWLLAPLRGFGDRLGAVLFRVPDEMKRRGAGSDAALRTVLEAWPRDIPLVVELQDPSWHVDETFEALREHAATLCTTELPEDDEPPIVRLTGPSLYLRLRRHDYSDGELQAWADRVLPFLGAGHDVYAFFRHDEVGRGAELALAFDAAVRERLPR